MGDVTKVGEVSKLLGQEVVLPMAAADVLGVRERHRKRRLIWLTVFLAPAAFYLWYRIATSRAFVTFPRIDGVWLMYLPMLAILILVSLVMLIPFLGAGRSPHVLYRPEQIEVTLEDVKGLESVKEEVIRTLNIFLGYATFRRELGGNPRRGVLFEGPPGTGKTHLAKAMARHAGVPFLFVSGPAFQSMWYGMTARKIRSYFKALKKTARREGGAIGFIEEIDAFAVKRGGMSFSPAGGASVVNPSISEGTGGTVNELLIQMQSFDDPPGSHRFINRSKDFINLFLPLHRQIKKKPVDYANVLVIAATNRGDMLDPALMRPGRFDRKLYFDLPSRAGRVDLIDYFLAKKSHAPDLDDPAKRDELAGMTFGYTPAMLEHIFDEGLVWALRGGRDAMTWTDLTHAKLTTEIGLPNHTVYTDAERNQIALHEAGHATVAYLVGAGRKLEVLSIIKRREALGMLAHSDLEERFTKTRTELEGMIKISLGGMVAEEIFTGESGTGPAGDLAYATTVAAEMIGSLGLGSSLVSFRAVGENNVFDPGLVGRVLSNSEAKRAVESLLRKEKRDVLALLGKNRHLVLALRDALLEYDELIGEDILRVLEGAGGRTRKPSNGSRAKAAARGRSTKVAATPPAT